MKRMQVTCGNCAGIGHTVEWRVVGDGIAQGEDVVCESCDGKGWTEYAVFSVEEAEAILKHCGLTTES